MSENFAARLKPAKWATKNDIADFVKNTDFDKKLASINKKVTSNKTRHVEVDKKLNNLSGKVKLISIKGLTKDLINGCSIFNAAKYFIELRLWGGNVKVCQMKVLNLLLHQTIVLI